MSKQMDKRVIKTRRRLHTALLGLMKNKNIRDISVKELVGEARINRSTFYLHYDNIFDILDELEAGFLEETEQVLNRDYPVAPEETGSSFSFVVDYMNLCFGNLPLFQALFGPNGDPAFREKIKRMITDKVTDRISEITGKQYITARYIAGFYVDGSIDMMLSWVLTGNHPNTEKISLLAYHIILSNVEYLRANPDIDQWLFDNSNSLSDCQS